MTVPAFGEWDMKNGAVPDYSMDFSKIREMRKQNKRELSRASLGGDEELLAQQQKAAPQPAPNATAAVDDHRRPLHAAHDDSPTGRKKFLSYFQCCIRA
uniref:RIN4 pathogenic type III effector avirulence factor Avr cleavage site domain-containing protein n=2 Tax=Oryza brachyantha TaxID=4533 RepID=J3N2I1_ORYBR